MYRILVLNDNPVMLKGIRVLLETEGYRVTCVTDSHAALSVLHEEPVDLFVQDILRPEMNGFELYWLMKSNKELENVPIVILTNLPAVEMIALENPSKGISRLYSVKLGVSAEHLATVSDIENADVLRVEGYLHSSAGHRLAETARAILAESAGAG
jgi:CheY-like chemotaxis protein